MSRLIAGLSGYPRRRAIGDGSATVGHLDLEERVAYCEYRVGGDDPRLTDAVLECIERMRLAATAQGFVYMPDRDARRRSSSDVLERLLARGDDVSDIRVDESLSNCLVLNTGGLPGSVLDDEVVRSRRRVDDLVTEQLGRLLGGDSDAACSGHLWYPAGSHMGWHTTLGFPAGVCT